jgi:hypothetical protein
MRRTIPICLKLKKAQLVRGVEILCPALFFLLLASMTAGAKPATPGTLQLTLLDEASGRPTPARVELLDAQHQGYVAQDALPIDGDCVDRDIPADYTLERAIAVMSKQFVNPYTKTVQFYSVGKSFVSMPPGDYRLIVRKGPEFQLQKRDVHINSGETVDLKVQMSRWINLPAEGWYSADDHLHIARPVKELNPFISKWMQAEDVHVANLLEWGMVRHFHNALQYAFGEEGQYREGDYILATGQENPRTHFRGHTIILGGKTPINVPEAYVIYQLFWQEAERQGALKGYAHFGKYEGAEYGLSMDLPGRLLNFIEVLQFEHGVYDVWYDILNMGFRMTPTAGTDYPCGDASVPGRERFYTQVPGPLTYEAWLDGVRKGRTFVTNGPMLDFHINGKGIGDEVLLNKPGKVLLEGRVRFDLTRDDVGRLDVIVNGSPVESYTRGSRPGEITFQLPYEFTSTSWVALRALGGKMDEALGRFAPFFVDPTSQAHTAPIYVTIQGAPPLSAQPAAKVLARKWLAKLDYMQARLAEDQLPNLAAPPGASDGVDLETLRKNREALLQAIQAAKQYFTEMAR